MKCLTLEQAFMENIKKVIIDGEEIGNSREVLNASLEITEPRQRYIFNGERKMDPFYAFGQVLWYLSGSNNLNDINYYDDSWNKRSDDGKTLNSAYGYKIFNPEFFGFSQYKRVLSILRENPDSRQAIINLHKPNDKKTNDELCTIYLHFFIRKNKLHMIVNMRSNDAFWGFTYDIFAFTFIQEMMALELGVELGSYYHNAGSMHVYDKDREQILSIINNENYKRSEIIMPKEFLDNIPTLLKAEKIIRNGGQFDVGVLNDRFSRNIVMILQIKRLLLEGKQKEFILGTIIQNIDIYDEHKILLINYILEVVIDNNN